MKDNTKDTSKIQIITPPGINKKGYFYEMWEKNKNSDGIWIEVDIGEDKFKKEFMGDFTKSKRGVLNG